MKTKTLSITLPAELPVRYAELVALHMPRPIHDRVAYDNTVEVVDALAGHKLNADQEDYLELLSQLVETYEADHLKSYPKVKGLGALQFLVAENQLTGDDLAKLLGVDRSTAYKILKGARNVTTEHIRILCARFSVSAELFIG
ncbi:MAG: helix-turn-helix domain-containing protein [Opitutaceae bacterium]|jgi:HTH-type transcriptional regulator/antitoxin HigA